MLRETMISLLTVVAMVASASAQQDKMSLDEKGPITTPAGDGSDIGRISAITLDLETQYTPAGAKTTFWKFKYHYSNSPGYQKGNQTIHVDLLDKNNNIIVKDLITPRLHTEHCWYNGGTDFQEKGYVGFDFVGKGVEKMRVHLDPRSGEIGKC
jgi:hypothetical protein